MSETSSDKTVFISYAQKDVDQARNLYEELKQAGLEPWFEEESLLPGQKRDLMIRQAIRNNRYFLVLLSPNSVKEGSVNREVARALDRIDDFPEQDTFIIPVKIGECDPVHEKLSDLKAVDLYLDWDKGMAGIRQTITNDIHDKRYGVGGENEPSDKPDKTASDQTTKNGDNMGKNTNIPEETPSQPPAPETKEESGSKGLIFLVLILLILASVGIGYLSRNALFILLNRNPDEFSQAIIYIIFVIVSLVAAIVVYGFMKATGFVSKAVKDKNQEQKYEFGGAMAGFFVTLTFLVSAYHLNAPSQPQELVINGNVGFEEDQSPVENAIVGLKNLPGYETRTDHFGNFTLRLPANYDRNVYFFLINYGGSYYTRKVERSEIEGIFIQIPKPETSDNFMELKTKMAFIRVPGGNYKMGCPEDDPDCNSYEKPEHSVYLDDFWIGKYEVTQAQWKFVMGDNPSNFQKEGDDELDYPVENVSWHEVQRFVEKMNRIKNPDGKTYRLPTEAEWEYACSKGLGRKDLPESTVLSQIAWYSQNKNDATAEIGGRDPFEHLEIYDMLGNVWEWCQDAYDAKAYRFHRHRNPENLNGIGKVIRGGSWGFDPKYLRCTARKSSPAEMGTKNIGFRLVMKENS